MRESLNKYVFGSSEALTVAFTGIHCWTSDVGWQLLGYSMYS
jgi:hypothetical protein